jgi:hypothetical protein
MAPELLVVKREETLYRHSANGLARASPPDPLKSGSHAFASAIETQHIQCAYMLLNLSRRSAEVEEA